MTMYYSCLIFAVLLSFPSAYGVDLEPNYYEAKCPNIEGAIANAVATEEGKNQGICAGVIRLFFHDCFVNGCDGSVLLDFPDLSSEKYSPDNLGLRGFEVIEAAKEAAEASCGNRPSPVVSCADVLAYAARDCVKLLGDFTYNVVAGRLDSRVSKAGDTKGNLPGAKFGVEQLKTNFANKGLSAKDLVALTGAHSIGQAHCTSFSDRYTNIVDNEINRTYASELKTKCDSKPIVDQDYVTPNRLDVQWYTNENANKVLFFSDWVLRTDTPSQNLMNNYANLNVDLLTFTAWQDDFGKAMVKMGNILGGDGEIRKVCSARN
ncbi:cationic peroxidase 1-like [Carex rostrata]